MTIYTEGVRVRQNRALEEFDSPLSDVLDAATTDALYNSPTQQLGRIAQDYEASSGYPLLEKMRTMADVPLVGPLLATIGQSEQPVAPGPHLSAQEAQARINAAGVKYTTPAAGMTEGALNLAINRKRAEMAREDVLNRAPKGVISTTLQVGAELGASMLDPLNVAASFVPVVGEERYAAMLERAAGPVARAFTRAGVGAVEGAAGQAILEPLNAYSHISEQDDYTMAQAISNIAFGAIMGGGLHVGAGVLADAMKMHGKTIDEKVDSLPETPPQPGITPVHELEPAPERTAMPPLEAERGLDQADLIDRLVAARSKPGFQRTAEDLLTLKAERTPDIDRAVDISLKPGFLRTQEERIFLDGMRKGKWNMQARVENAAPEVQHAALKTAVAQAVQGEPIEVQSLFGLAAQTENPETAAHAATESGAPSAKMLQFRPGTAVPMSLDEVREAASRQTRASTLGDAGASLEAKAKVAAQPADELAAAKADLEYVNERLPQNIQDEPEMQEASTVSQSLTRYTAAVKAAAHCLI